MYMYKTKSPENSYEIFRMNFSLMLVLHENFEVKTNFMKLNI